MASYAEVASMGANQSPEEAAAPQPPEIISTESTSTSSLIDVDTPSVRTVPSDFLEQEIQTETQAARIEREQAAAEAASSSRSKKPSGGLVACVNQYLTNAFAGLSDGAASAVVFGNLVGVVGVSAWLSYKAWGLYEQGRLNWKGVGLGVTVMGAVGAVEVVLGGYLYKTKASKARKSP